MPTMARIFVHHVMNLNLWVQQLMSHCVRRSTSAGSIPMPSNRAGSSAKMWLNGDLWLAER